MAPNGVLRSARRLIATVFSWIAMGAFAQPALEREVATLAAQFDAEVERRLDVPLLQRRLYFELLEAQLRASAVALAERQHVVLVDRSANVQAIMILLFDPPAQWHWIGASAVSTGRPGQFDHFLTPIGVFAHTLENPDFRAEGTYNENHIRGYGARGMRVFDFGWVEGERAWGTGGTSPMRLQMHATDPTALESRLGTAQSKGCIRISSTLNRFIDHRGIIDADYEQALLRGERLWVLSAERKPAPWPGRYLVVIDSRAPTRPGWSPVPMKALMGGVGQRHADTCFS
jgi:hypothetical protein